MINGQRVIIKLLPVTQEYINNQVEKGDPWMILFNKEFNTAPFAIAHNISFNYNTVHFHFEGYTTEWGLSAGQVQPLPCSLEGERY